MKHVFILATFLATSAPVTRANQLLDVYRQALARDAILQSMSQQRAAQIEARPQAIAALLPQVQATAQHTRDRYAYAQPVDAVDDAPDLSQVGPLQDHYGNTRSLGLTVSQTLWSVESFQRLKAGNLEAAAAETGFQAALQRLLLRVAEAYFGILSAADQLDTNLAERDAFKVLLDQAGVREQTGVGPRSDVVQAQSFYDATLQSVIDAQNRQEDARRALQTITGEYRERLAALRDDIPLRAPDPATVEDWVGLARNDNLALRAAELRTEAASRRAAAQRASGLPTLALRGSVSRLRQDDVLGSDRNYDTVGIAVNWPLFQGGAVASRARESRAIYRQAEADYDQQQRDTERLTRQAWRGTVTGIERIRVGERAVVSSRSAVESARHNVEFGTGSEFELLNAQNLHFTAQRAWHQARFDYLLDALRLKELAGQLDERDLAQVDALLLELTPLEVADVP